MSTHPLGIFLHCRRQGLICNLWKSPSDVQLSLNYVLITPQFLITPCRTSIQFCNNQPSGCLVSQITSEILTVPPTVPGLTFLSGWGIPHLAKSKPVSRSHLSACFSDPSQHPCANLRPLGSRCQDEIRHARSLLGEMSVMHKGGWSRIRHGDLQTGMLIWHLWKEKGKEGFGKKSPNNSTVVRKLQLSQWGWSPQAKTAHCY